MNFLHLIIHLYVLILIVTALMSWVPISNLTGVSPPSDVSSRDSPSRYFAHYARSCRARVLVVWVLTSRSSSRSLCSRSLTT